MALNIKNVRAEQLAQEVARRTGESLTAAVIGALEERLERLSGRREPQGMMAALLDISDRCHALPDLDVRSADEILGYDEHGSFPHGA